MNGKNLLIGLSYIDRKYIEESENDLIFSKHGTYEKNRQSTATFRKYLIIAAVIVLLTLTVTACAVVYSRIHMKLVQHNPEVTVQQDSQEQLTRETGNTAVDVLLECYPQSLPEGYRILSGSSLDYHSRNICYRNDTGSIIHFRISTKSDFDISLKPPVEEKSLEISGQAATLRTSGDTQLLLWQNETEGYYASLLTEDGQADLISMAESVSPGEALPLSFLYHRGQQWDIWYPQKLPEGYRCSDVSPVGSDGQSVRYENDGSYIHYHISTVEPIQVTDPPHDSAIWEETLVGEQPARLMTTSSGLRILLWENKTEGFYAMLETGDESVDLMAVAESVAPGEKLEVSAHYLGPDYSIELEQEPSEYVGFEPVYPQKVPEGYSISFVSDPAYGEQNICYENADGNTISFTLYFRLGQWGRQFDGMGQPEPVDINGHMGYRIGNSLIWTDEKRGFGFYLFSGEDMDLLTMAESVAPGPELTPSNADKTDKALEQLGNYQITALPKGMVEDGLTGVPLEKSSDWYSYVRRWYFDRSTNQGIYFEYESYITDPSYCSTAEDVLRMFTGEGDNPVQMVTINDCSGAFLQNESDASVVWLIGDAAKGTMFKLYSKDYSAEELVDIAKSVQKQP